MKIISHRGYWKEPAGKNTAAAFRRSFALGYGTETDVRDCMQALVIAHDPPAGGELGLGDVLAMAVSSAPGSNLLFALNIKADGLATQVARAVRAHPELDCFVFDMSVPDQRAYHDEGVPVFSRMSEVEREPVWLARAAGVWLDAFASDWYSAMDVARLLESGKRVCIVSPELHGREPLPRWNGLLELRDASGLILCTDFPERARDFFFPELP